MDFLFSTSPLTFVTSCLCGDSYFNRCEVISHCGFDCISLMINDIVHLMYLLWKNLCIFFGRSPCSVPLSIFELNDDIDDFCC